jgi:hypothetical protein
MGERDGIYENATVGVPWLLPYTQTRSFAIPTRPHCPVPRRCVYCQYNQCKRCCKLLNHSRAFYHKSQLPYPLRVSHDDAGLYSRCPYHGLWNLPIPPVCIRTCVPCTVPKRPGSKPLVMACDNCLLTSPSGEH